MDMKWKNLIYVLPVVLAFVACTDKADDSLAGGDICLNAAVGEIESRAETLPYLGTTPTTGNPLRAWVWFSEDATEYGNSEVNIMTHLPCRTVMTFEGAPVFAYNATGQNLKYDTGSNSTVYCVGFYPAENVWETTDGKTATATVDGSSDLMYAPKISGTWGDPLQTQTYQHLQNWVKVCVCATSQDAADVWGKITDISVSTQTSVSVDVTTDAITYSDDGTMPVFDSKEGQPLHTTMQEFGSVFCSPAEEYTVSVTIGGKTVSQTITVEPLESGIDLVKGGNLVILTLYFQPFNMIEGVCTLNAWDAQNEDLYMKEPVQNE